MTQRCLASIFDNNQLPAFILAASIQSSILLTIKQKFFHECFTEVEVLLTEVK